MYYGSSLPLNSPHNALCSAANVTDLLVPPWHIKYCVTDSGGVVVPRQGHLHSGQAVIIWVGENQRKYKLQREKSLSLQVYNRRFRPLNDAASHSTCTAPCPFFFPSACWVTCTQPRPCKFGSRSQVLYRIRTLRMY